MDTVIGNQVDLVDGAEAFVQKIWAHRCNVESMPDRARWYAIYRQAQMRYERRLFNLGRLQAGLEPITSKQVMDWVADNLDVAATKDVKAAVSAALLVADALGTGRSKGDPSFAPRWVEYLVYKAYKVNSDREYAEAMGDYFIDTYFRNQE